MRNKPIGIFDSGIGGLTVLKEIRRLLPCEDIIYFGDTARVPYGGKSKSTVVKFSVNNTLFLLKKKVKIVVVACNTSSSVAINHLRDIFSIPIIGVIEAGVNRALELSPNKKIAIIGTRSTIESKSYQKQIKSKDKKTKLYAKSCPLFVPLVEEGILNGNIVKEAMNMYLEELKQNGVDTIILGCTHYPLLKKQITRYLKGVFVVDSAKEVAQHTRDVLTINGLVNKKKKTKEEFYVSDDPEGFMRSAQLFLKRKISKPKIANV